MYIYIYIGHISLISGSCFHILINANNMIYQYILLVGLCWAILCLTIIHKFSIGFISGELSGHGRMEMFLFLRKAVTNFAV